MSEKLSIFVMAILLMIALPLMAEFQIWGGVYGTVFDSYDAELIDSLGLDYVFVSTVYDSSMGSLAFPALDGHARTDLELMSDGVKTMAQQTHCEDVEFYLKEAHIDSQGSAVLRAAAAHYENWEAESTMVSRRNTDELPLQNLVR
ncbi:hypothetical protein KAH81_04600 [bacterium]|nr:hypothetical protein [bacterium]